MMPSGRLSCVFGGCLEGKTQFGMFLWTSFGISKSREDSLSGLQASIETMKGPRSPLLSASPQMLRA